MPNTMRINGNVLPISEVLYAGLPANKVHHVDGGVWLRSGEDVSPVLSENSWQTISRLASEGLASHYWNVGDEIDITLMTGEVLTLQIYGFGHDTLANDNIAGITFGLKNLMANSMRMNSDTVNTGGGWVTFDAFSWITTELYDQLPLDVKEVILPAKKLYNASNSIESVIVNVFHFSRSEVHPNPSSNTPHNQGGLYPIFIDNASRIKHMANGSGAARWWWTRSTHINGNNMMIMLATGAADANNMTSSVGGICFGFCVGDAG